MARSGKARGSETPFLAFWDKCLLAPLLEIHRSARYCSKASARAPNSLRSVIPEARKHRRTTLLSNIFRVRVTIPPLWRLRCAVWQRSEEHTSELQSLMRISYAVFCLKKKQKLKNYQP